MPIWNSQGYMDSNLRYLIYIDIYLLDVNHFVDEPTLASG